jgi:hypothetical protein
MLKYVDLICDLQAERPGSQWVQISQGEIGKRVGVAGNTVAPRLQKLVSAGLLDRHLGNHGMGIPDSYRAGWWHEMIAAAKESRAAKVPVIETRPMGLTQEDIDQLPAAVELVERVLNSVVSSAG